MRTHRLLAKHEYQNEILSRELQNKVSYNRDNYKLDNGKGNNNTFEQLKLGRSNNVYNYLRSYKKRYSKKNGLSKLDCYCEKILLDKIHGLHGVGGKSMHEKESFKKIILKKSGIGLILFSLITSLSFIFPILFGFEDLGNGLLDFCTLSNHKDDSTIESCTKWHKYKWENSLTYIYLATKVLTYPMIIIMLLFIFYTLIKVIKYEKLKSGKDKMSLKEYFRFCKDVFI
ncbi:hypothetical protein PVMG_06185 [Plasmodium vivax Mauritania I]|uniref:Variable surface protein Vir35 n=1 Tax=Plasmodium vivax Mauritania I TaxID=1035515 RepID=A0A0J9T3K6_PLAVI|nr:hypothetical protein PVMG_06185 [Plasmodium vivax Mauritania I]